MELDGKQAISVFIIAKNEADRIGDTIRSVSEWVDEVVVVDSGSEDETVKVCEALGVKVSFMEWHGYGPQKVYAESLCRNSWLFNLDADEVVSPQLRDEICAVFQHGEPAMVAYRMPFQPIYYVRDKGHPATARHSPVRLYRKDKAGFKDSPIHDSVVVREGAVGCFSGVVLHKSFRNLSDHVQKADFYSTMQAEDMLRKNRRPSVMLLMILPLFAFLKSYVLRKEYRNGIEGVIASHMYAFQRFLRQAKTFERYWEAERKRK
jgi:glycosyltransferase involved in cell wall biosynthesis